MSERKTRRGKRHADDAFLAAYACGATLENAAAKAGISRSTAHRRLQDPDFQRRLAEVRAEPLRRATDMLTALTLEAVNSLYDLQKINMPCPVRLGAAKAIIELGARLRENYDLAQRLAALEQQQKINETTSS
jgi:hypothetical protein